MIKTKKFISSPAAGTGVFGATYYCESNSLRLENLYNMASQSDAPNLLFVRYSDNNGRNWGEAKQLEALAQLESGVKRTYHRGGYLDTATGRYISIRNEGIFPDENFDVDICLRSLQLHYKVSEDGGRSFIVDEPIIQKGNDFNIQHPLPGVWRGKNSVILGDYGCRPITLPDSTILVPCQISPVDNKGNYINLGNGYTYHDAAVIIGKWMPDKKINWTLSSVIKANPQLSTRGLLEPTLGILADGSILMIMRGSNEIMLARNPDKAAAKSGLAGYKWFAISKDGGYSWSEALPWTYTDGETFYSPSSCSQLLLHSSEKLLWFGNITPSLTEGNSPRYPLVFGIVDLNTGKLIKDSIQIIDTRGDNEPDNMTLSNFCAREDRENGDILLHMPRLGIKKDFLTSDLFEYRFSLA